jgi:hypothetical protein
MRHAYICDVALAIGISAAKGVGKGVPGDGALAKAFWQGTPTKALRGKTLWRRMIRPAGVLTAVKEQA